MENEHHVLIVDDDAAVSMVLAGLVRQGGYRASTASSGAEALAVLEKQPIDLVVTDLRMPGMDGLELLRQVSSRWTDLPVIMLTAHGTVSVAVEAMKIGARDFILKPFEREEVLHAIQRSFAFVSSSTVDRVHDLPDGLIGGSKALDQVRDLVRRTAASKATVLIRGESGTGKGVVARMIHDFGPRSERPFIKIHCAALPETLLESELFGYEKGAFTGATQRKPGRVELAEDGTLFLDEIGDLSPSVQVKLLRLLQEREYERLGGAMTLKTPARFIAATNRDLEALMAEGAFREDLFYRLNVVPVFMPALREIREEVEPLSRAFFQRACEDNDRLEMRLAESAIEELRRLEWQGNMRQLENFVERLVVLSDGPEVGREDVARELGRGPDRPQALPSVERGPDESLESKRRETERDALLRALERTNNNRTAAARVLGISRRTLYNKLKEQGLD